MLRDVLDPESTIDLGDVSTRRQDERVRHEVTQ